MLSLCVEDYFLKGLEISWWRMCRASAWSRYLPWWVLECRETGNHSPTCSRGWAAASVTPANTAHHRVNSGHERSAAPHWCKWQHCRAVSHRCCLSGVRGQSDRVIKLELVTAAGWTGRNCELAGCECAGAGVEWSLCPLLCSRLWKSRASVWDGEPQRPAPHRRTAGPAPGGPGLLLLPTSHQLISLKCILGSRQ